MDNLFRRDNEQLYLFDETIAQQFTQARKRNQQLNQADPWDVALISRLSAELLGKSQGAHLRPPFYCEYGFNIETGKNFFANFNCTILDVAKVIIGDNVMLAPNVAIYTAGHPIHPEVRNGGLEYGIGVTIGNNVWIGGNAVICPGVHIGDNVVIGAGSVVTKDIPPNTIAAGNPCRVLRPITDADRPYYFRDRKIDPEARAYLEAKGILFPEE